MPTNSKNNGVNRTKPDRWKADIARSVDMYNDWFMKFAPSAYRQTRIQATKDVESTLTKTNNLKDIKPGLLQKEPGVLPTLRMATCPPLAVDRLIGLAGVSGNLVGCMEKGKLPVKTSPASLMADLTKIGAIIEKMADPDIFVWLNRKEKPIETEIHRAATIVADRLCGAVANPIIRNAQEKRQLAMIAKWLEKRGYKAVAPKTKFDAMAAGTYGFRINVPVVRDNGGSANIPVDAVVMPLKAKKGAFPLLIEAKSAGDFTNVNKRRKEEAAKMTQLRATFGKKARYVLFLCGYFDGGYLGYEAAEGIDWVWEHRIDELAEFGL